MTMHIANYEYMIPEYGVIDLDLDPTLSKAEKEEIILREIEDVYPDIEDINIVSIKEDIQ